MSPARSGRDRVELCPWSNADLWVAERFLSDAAMMGHLGGPQDRARILEAHHRSLGVGASGDGLIYTVRLIPVLTVIGTLGWWNRIWRDEQVHEVGWSIFPQHQGQGFAGEAAALLVDSLRRDHTRRHAHAFPALANAPSNALCARLGFANLGECEVEYPAGHPMRCNDWCVDLAG